MCALSGAIAPTSPYGGQTTRDTPIRCRGREYTKRSELQPGYHDDKGGTKLFERFPVPRAVVERLAVAPRRGIVDGDVGPVLPNDAKTRRALRAARVIPERPNAEAA